MNRRELLVGAGAVLVAAAANADKTSSPPIGNTLLAVAQECERKAQLCLSHCIQMFGNSEMAGCAAAVRDTIASSHALAVLAAANSKHSKELAKVCAAVCKDCEAECRKHEKMPVCKDCADACAKMIQEIARL